MRRSLYARLTLSTAVYIVTLSDLAPKLGERAAIVGLSGSGKSVLGRNLIHVCRNVVAIDPKNEFNPEGYTVITKPDEFRRTKRYPILYRPPSNYFDSTSAYNELFHQVFERENCTVYNDEIAAFTNANSFPHYLKVLYMQGRSKHISCIGCMQRPASVPLFCLSESSRFYFFGVNNPDDRKRMAVYCRGYDAEDLQDFEFWYYNIRKRGTAERMIMPSPTQEKQLA